MGDRIYTSDGKRKYIGLHNELLDRPWTAKKRRRQVANVPHDQYWPTDTAGLTAESIGACNPSVLGDIRRIAEVFRDTLREFESISRFTNTEEARCNAQLQHAKSEVHISKHNASIILSRCLVDLSNLANATHGWIDQVRVLTKRAPNWWEGYNVFLGGTLTDERYEHSLTIYRYPKPHDRVFDA